MGSKLQEDDDNIDLWLNDGPVCPHCEYEHHVSHIDAECLPWTEDTPYEFQCSKCEKEFMVVAVISHKWTTYRENKNA